MIVLVILELHLGPHKYTYVHGDPITGIDPTGLNASFSLGGILGTIGIIAKWSAITLPAVANVLVGVRESKLLARSKHRLLEYTVDVDVVAIRAETRPMWVDVRGIKQQIKEANDFWVSRANTVMKVRSFEIIDSDRWADIQTSQFGNGEINDAMNTLRVGNRPLIVFTETVNSGDYDGMTEWNRKGLVVHHRSHGSTLTHEFGHLGRLKHTDGLESLSPIWAYLFTDRNLMHSEKLILRDYDYELTQGQVVSFRDTMFASGFVTWGINRHHNWNPPGR